MPGSRWSDLDRPPLDARALNRALGGGPLWRQIRVVDDTGSTNADVAEAARAGEPEGLVLVAEHQSAGRGRLGRVWSAPPRSSLAFSMLLRPAVPAGRWSLLPLLVGVAVARAVAKVAEVDVRLKWPNDLLIGERKLGGILAERVESPEGAAAAAALVGVGLNVTLRDDELPVPQAISLKLAEAACTDRDTLLRASLRAIAEHYARWQAAGGAPEQVLPAYRGLCATIGRDVRAELPGGVSIEGRAVAIDADGSLAVDTPAGRRAVGAGDVVHLR